MNYNYTSPMHFIRTAVFGMTQVELAEAIGARQSNISYMETRARDIPPRVMRRIRALAQARGVDWDDSWFFEVPVRSRRAA